LLTKDIFDVDTSIVVSKSS